MDEPELIEFRPDDRAAVVARMTVLAQDRSGWINLQPGIDPDDEPPPRSALSGLLSGQGPEVALATWTPGERRRRRTEPITIGIQHASGTRVSQRLAAMGTPVPDGWRVIAEHSRRGLVVEVPDDADHDAVLRWLLAAGEALTPRVPLTGMWRASVYLSG